MNRQPDNRPLASVEADLFGTLFAFHKKIMTLLRESSLDDEKVRIVGDRINTMLDEATSEMKAQQVNLAERLDAAYEEARRLVEELSHSDDGVKEEKAKLRKGRKNKP